MKPRGSFIEGEITHIEQGVKGEQNKKDQEIIQKREVLFLMKEILDQFDRVIEILTKEFPEDEREGKYEEKSRRMEVIKKIFDRIIETREKNPDSVHEVLNPVILGLNYPNSMQEDNPDVKIFVDMLEGYRARGYKDGERIFELEGEGVQRSEPHPQGIVVQKGDSIILNGSKLLYKGKCDDWYVHREGVVVKKGNQLLLNGKKLMYEGPCSNAWYSEIGFMVLNQKKSLFKDGKLWLEGDRYTDFKPHRKGTIVKYTYTNSFPDPIKTYSYAINQVPLTYNASPEKMGATQQLREDFSEFQEFLYIGPHPTGIMFIQATGKHINKEKKGTLILAEPSNDSHDRRLGKFLEITPLRENISSSQLSLHPQGFTLVDGDSIFLNDQSLFTGDFEEYVSHQNGVVVKNNNEWRLYAGKPDDMRN